MVGSNTLLGFTVQPLDLITLICGLQSRLFFVDHLTVKRITDTTRILATRIISNIQGYENLITHLSLRCSK